MIVITKPKIFCENCNIEFASEFGHGGAIEHENITSSYNIDCFIADFDNEENIDFLVRSLSNICGNHCNIKDNNYEIGLQIFDCAVILIDKKGRKEIAEILKKKRSTIKNAYNKVTQYSISQLENKIENLKTRIIK